MVGGYLSLRLLLVLIRWDLKWGLMGIKSDGHVF